MRRAIAIALVFASACTELPDGSDASVDGSATQLFCTTDEQCSDGRFCNGEERCRPDLPWADTRGCVAGEDPCPGQRCEEEAGICTSCDEPDADGDGYDDYRCGGDDCDDNDPRRNPGETEVCDPEHLDEDCDPTTFGLDVDDDGEDSYMCCNLIDGILRCGSDCDDSHAGINTSAVEVCNGIDDDCDGSIDEGTQHMIYPDDDGDGFGRTRDGRHACTLPPGRGFSFIGGDCDDTDPVRNPANVEICNGIDDDCDGSIDEGCPCNPGQSRACGERDREGELVEIGSCQSGDQICREGTWSSCIMATGPQPERCNHVDDDCDGRIDEGQTILLFLDFDGDGFGDPREPRESCGPIAGYVTNADDCDDRAAWRYPGAVEVCDGLDQDCDGRIDEGLAGCMGCTDGETAPCTTACGTGFMTCTGGVFGECIGPSPSPEVCNGLDDDCDGIVDEGLSRCEGCTEGEIYPCDTICGPGTAVCMDNELVGCTARIPTPEVCNGLDDDCDNIVDEGFPECDGCTDGETRGCTNACGDGVERCVDGRWSDCDARTPTPEVCNGLDDDCDNIVDEGFPECDGCTDGETDSCVRGCATGVKMCVGGMWSDCTAPPPPPEVCNGEDDDCDNETDEGLVGCDGCENGDTEACSHPCGEGIRRCVRGMWSECSPKSGECDGDDEICADTNENPICDLIPPLSEGNSAGAGGSPSASIWHAFDDDSSTAWSAMSTGPVFLSYKFDQPRAVHRYAIQLRPEDLSAAPMVWTLLGLSAEGLEVELDRRTMDRASWEECPSRVFRLDTTEKYQHYKLIIEASVEGGTGIHVSIAEFALGGEEGCQSSWD